MDLLQDYGQSSSEEDAERTPEIETVNSTAAEAEIAKEDGNCGPNDADGNPTSTFGEICRMNAINRIKEPPTEEYPALVISDQLSTFRTTETEQSDSTDSIVEDRATTNKDSDDSSLDSDKEFAKILAIVRERRLNVGRGTTENTGKTKFSKPLRNAGELADSDLPPIERLTISIGPEVAVQPLGLISSVVENLVVIKSEFGVPPLDAESVIFDEHRKPLGRVFEIFGQVTQPFYSVRFNNGTEIEERGLSVGFKTFFAPREEQLTRPVFTDHLRKLRYTDASWKCDGEEPPDECEEFSDDEAEKRFMAKKRKQTLRIQALRDSGVHPSLITDSDADVEDNSECVDLSTTPFRGRSRGRGRGRHRGRRGRGSGHANHLPPANFGFRPNFSQLPPPRFAARIGGPTLMWPPYPRGANIPPPRMAGGSYQMAPPRPPPMVYDGDLWGASMATQQHSATTSNQFRPMTDTRFCPG